MANGWLTFLSRLIPHSTDTSSIVNHIYNTASHNLNLQFGKNNLWLKWFKTPMSCGGGGVTETSDKDFNWYSLEHDIDFSNLPKRLVIPGLLGAAKRKIVEIKKPVITPINMILARQKMQKVLSSDKESVPNMFRSDTNSTNLIFDIMFNKTIPSKSYINSKLIFPIPNSYRIVSRRRLVEYLLTPAKEMVGYTSITHTKEMISVSSNMQRYLLRQFLYNNKKTKRTQLKTVATLWFMEHFVCQDSHAASQKKS